MSVMINDPVHVRIWTSVSMELVKAKDLHPTYPDDPVRQTAIVLEELLEAATVLQRAALQVGRVGNDEIRATKADLYKELVHTAAMCVRQMEVLEG